MTTVLITGIGGSIGIDVARSLRRDPSIRLIGADANPWGRRQAGGLVDELVDLPRADRDPAGFADAFDAAVARLGIDFAFVNPDPELESLAAIQRGVACPSTMPAIDKVAICIDKARTVAAVADPALFPATVEVRGEADIDRAFAELSPPLWMRAAVGPGGRGSLPVEDAAEARAWIRYWSRRKGKDWVWVLQELLPGRNLNWTGVYVGGRLVCQAAMERLRYFLGDAAASGVSGQVAQCATVDPGGLREVADRVVRAIEPEPHGVYSVDLREDRDGKPRLTEVNPRLAGRPWLYTHAGVNVPLAIVRAFLGRDPGDAVAATDLEVGLHLYRQLDLEPVVGRPEES